MRPAAWNPTRRNRNIGTAKQGQGQANRRAIPKGWPDDRVFWEVLRRPVELLRVVAGHSLRFLIEPTTPGFAHACTPDDVCHVLAHVPREHLRELELVIFRQPTRKENLLCPSWGRLAYYARTGRYSGTSIYLEATQPGHPIRWSRKLGPDDTAELYRLRRDGHPAREDRRAFVFEPTLASIRATQLYRTVLHEMGHLADWYESVLQNDAERASAAYERKPVQDKEVFAHRYADEARARLEVVGVLPFARLFDAASLQRDGLSPAWFLPVAPASGASSVMQGGDGGNLSSTTGNPSDGGGPGERAALEVEPADEG
jgi:hypothetical protein